LIWLEGISSESHSINIYCRLPQPSHASLPYTNINIMRFTIVAIATLASSAAAIGNAVIKNNCPQTIYAWSVGSSMGAQQTIATGKSPTRPSHHHVTFSLNVQHLTVP
jgi:hypothetical protein